MKIMNESPIKIKIPTTIKQPTFNVRKKQPSDCPCTESPFLIFFLLDLLMGRPQFGHEGALFDTFLPQSGHFINPITNNLIEM